MKPINLTIRSQQIVISFPFGNGGIAHLRVDGYYYGQFIKYRGKWEFRPQRDDHGFSEVDTKEMVEKIEAASV